MSETTETLTPESPWEDHLLERKTESDLRDLLKTLVAFANSVMPGHTAVLLIGEKDDGTVKGVSNADNIQKTVREKAESIYPPIVFRTRAYEEEGKSCVRVEVEYSGETPHFGGPAWIRKGSSSEKASDEVFQRLIEYRSGKVRELAKWLNKEVSIFGDESSGLRVTNTISFYNHRWPPEGLSYYGEDNALVIKGPVKLIHVNSFWATFEGTNGVKRSEPLEKITLSFDDDKNRLKVLVRY